jgi:DNA-binding NtrC family response regulator
MVFLWSCTNPDYAPLNRFEHSEGLRSKGYLFCFPEMGRVARTGASRKDLHRKSDTVTKDNTQTAGAKFTCLILEDDQVCSRIIANAIREEGGSAVICETLASAGQAIEQDHFDLAILDHNLPDGLGSNFFYHLVDRRELTLVIMLTGFPNLPKAVELTRSGLFDYLTKPFALHEVIAVIRRALQRIRQNEVDVSYPDYAGSSPGMREVQRMIQHAANHPQATILLNGETGTGKDITARLIHHLTFKTEAESKPLVRLNCSTLPADMFEAELFGAEKGAYTGAQQNRIGLCESANGGTLFLDEIAEVPLPLQAKLLQFLENFEYRRLGSTQLKTFKGRIIAATNKSLPQEVAQGRFREDLWYRLDVMAIHLPPLRDRKADLAQLAEVLLQKLAVKHGHEAIRLSDQDLAFISAYDFPGNIRELRNLLEKSLLQTEPTASWLKIDPVWRKKIQQSMANASGGASVPTPIPSPAVPTASQANLTVNPATVASSPTLSTRTRGNALEEQEFTLIQKVLAEEDGVIRRAAAKLGLSHQALLRRLEKWPELRVLGKPEKGENSSLPS